MSYAIRFEGVTKRYIRGASRYRTIRQDIAEGFRTAGRRVRGHPPGPRGRLALEDVSFDVPEGDSFALIGPNGAGKTTALKLISKIAYPTAGRIRVRGRIAALIEVGSGIHMELTGRENIMLYGQILGMTKREVRDRFEQIVEFAGLRDALDTQVKMYSSGMQVRLGFSIAAHLDPDSFLVDEALAVGDAVFQAKCVEHMSKLLAEGRTLMFVSHDLSAVEALCRRGVFVLDGRIRSEGAIGDVIRDYLRWVDTAQQARLAGELRTKADEPLAVSAATCHGADGGERYAFATGDDIEVRLRVRSGRDVARPLIRIGISDGRPGSLVVCSTADDGAMTPRRLVGESIVSCTLQRVPFLPREYQIWCSITSDGSQAGRFDWQPVGAFRIAAESGPQAPSPRRYGSTDGPIYVAHRWTVT